MKIYNPNLLGQVLVAATMVALPAWAQQITGELGSPSATTNIEDKQLPPPDPKFGGVIKDNAAQSKHGGRHAWRRKSSPNILLIMTDDVGFGAPSTFGGVIPTPALDRIAKAGLGCWRHIGASAQPFS